MNNPNKCKIQECTRDQRTHRMCAAHYHQAYTKGEIVTRNFDTPKEPKGYCLVNDCNNEAWVKGKCNFHYHREWANKKRLSYE